MELKTLLPYVEFKKKHVINDNLARLILHLGKHGETSFRDLIELNVLPTDTRCFRDLSQQIHKYVVTTRKGCHRTTIKHDAVLNALGKRVYLRLRVI